MTLDKLVLHAASRRQLESFAAHPAHALMLCGPPGIGKTTVADALAAQILGLTSQAFARHPYMRLLVPDERGTISIEVVRDLQRFLRLRTTGNAAMRRVAIVEYADAMTTEAQNAFLKILEEPPADTLLILTAASTQALLPTIRSRVQAITLRDPVENDLKAYFAPTGKTQKSIEQAYLLSGGLPGLMQALLAGDHEHPLVEAVAQAKQLLASPLFERLATADKLAKQKDTPVLLAMLRIAQAGLKQAAAKQDAARIKQWHRVRKQVLAAQVALDRNANAKLVYTNLMLQI